MIILSKRIDLLLVLVGSSEKHIWQLSFVELGEEKMENEINNNRLRPAGGVNHPDSVSAKVGKLAAKKALR